MLIRNLVINHQGFTLIESVLAILLLSVVLLPFMGAFNQSIHIGAQAGKNTQAVYLTSGRMELFKGLSYDELVKIIQTEKNWTKVTLGYYDSYFDMLEMYDYYHVIEENFEKKVKLINIKVKLNWYEDEALKEYVLSTLLVVRTTN